MLPVRIDCGLRQSGASFLFVVLVVLGLVVVIGVAMLLARLGETQQGAEATRVHMQSAATALEQFAAATGRLPCPADPRLDTGDASPNVPTTNCDFPTSAGSGVGGTLPWRTLGMRRDDSFDGWGWKISYRVYTNVVSGSLTQDKGASMVDCDAVEALPAALDANGLCPSAHNTLDTEFVKNKGLDVTDFGAQYKAATNNGAAYVLISHGPTGYGGYTTSGVPKPDPGSLEERRNAKAGPYTAQPASSPDITVLDPNFFDDVLLFRTVADLARRANLVARDWPDDVLSAVTFDSATVSRASGQSTPSGDLGVASLAFNYANVSGFNSGGALDLAFVGSGTPGLGAGDSASGGGNNLSSTGGEGLRIDLTQAARKFAVTLNGFGILAGAWTEQAEFRFYNGSSLVQAVVKQACNAGTPLASFSIDPGGDFTRVEIRPMITMPDPLFGTTVPSSFLVSEIRSCAASATTCTTSLSDPTNNCP